ncbi:MAG: proprotein convertase P-domain-containing protein, partial [Gammaproteobacteria bacterium]|nr:proprotein convertase P-domain-containing protein [Gammaproteobacteria bacterium]
MLGVINSVYAADSVFSYSSASQIRGVNLTLSTDHLLTTSPISSSVNALAVNVDLGLFYYGNGSTVYYWDPAQGAGASAHNVMHNFSTGSPSAPIRNLNSTAGSYIAGKYYIASETNSGYIEEVYEIGLSSDGRQVVSVTPLGLLAACNCSGVQIGGFGDITTRLEGGSVIIYGSSADISGNGSGTSSGRWRFDFGAGSWNLLTSGSGGQMANSPSGDLYTNIGNSIRTFDPVTGQAGNTNLLTTSSAIWDFSSGFLYDFGDAPDSYGSAFHRLSASQTQSVYLGQNPPDNESYSLDPSSAARGDDSTGSSDEDAVAQIQAISVGSSSYTLPVQCSTGAFVSAWMDLNLNGVFDTNERNDNFPLSCNANTTTLVWNNITMTQSGASMIRVRVSSNLSAVSGPVGLAPDGEVEDHALNIIQPSVGSCPAGSSSVIYSATDLPLPIGPNANTTTQSTISVPQSAVITDVNLINVIGTHTYMNDLRFTLVFQGQSEVLYGPTCNGSNNFSTGFDDEASGTAPCPPIDGQSYPPSGSLAAYDGLDAQGNWTLQILDRYNQDGGQLQRWELEICSAGGSQSNADVRLAKAASVSATDVEFTFRAVNTGDTTLSDVVIQDDLDAVFGAGTYSISQSPQLLAGPAGFVVNNGFDGSANQDLLAASGVLDVQEELIITVIVTVNDVQAPNGDYANQAQVYARDSASNNITDLSGPGSDLSTDIDAPTEFQIANNIDIAGLIFIDSSLSQSTSHDGIMQTGETPLAGRTIVVNDSNGNIIGQTNSAGDGSWSMQLDAAFANTAISVQLVAQSAYVSISESPTLTTGLVTDGLITIVNLPGLGVSDIDFGLIAMPALVADQIRSANAGSRVVLGHRYTASTNGVVSFALTESNGWSTALYHDVNCDAQLDAGEAIIAAGMPVSTGEEVCLNIDTFIPASAAAAVRQQIDISATLEASDDSGTNHQIQIELLNSDLITVASTEAGRLVLEKSVTNITKNGQTSVDNAATPGDTLEYRIKYRNQGAGAISDLEINDETPAFTSLQPASVSCGALPASV